ncbi:MAG: hypothetical protein KTU85_06140 [Acidimicrobiia bacterium]|nr:hypothetical protein [Acidimicrobiia bacterium]
MDASTIAQFVGLAMGLIGLVWHQQHLANRLRADFRADHNKLRDDMNEGFKELRLEIRDLRQDNDAAHREARRENEAAHREARRENEAAHREARRENEAAHREARRERSKIWQMLSVLGQHMARLELRMGRVEGELNIASAEFPETIPLPFDSLETPFDGEEQT